MDELFKLLEDEIIYNCAYSEGHKTSVWWPHKRKVLNNLPIETDLIKINYDKKYKCIKVELKDTALLKIKFLKIFYSYEELSTLALYHYFLIKDRLNEEII